METSNLNLAVARVLVMDDTPENINVLRGILQKERYRLFAASSGEAALKVAARIHPQIILMDVMMPGVNGFETCRRLKSIPELCHVRVIFITALNDTENLMAGFSAGGVDYINKPIRQQEVLARVRTHLQTSYLLEIQKQLSHELASKNSDPQKAYKELE
jgi:PleD family two-component response regulator